MEISIKVESRRTYIRIPLVMVAELSLGFQDKEGTDLFVRDFSVFGMGGYVNRSYRKGETVLVRIYLRTYEDEVIEESIMAQVRWCKRIKGENNLAVGLIFHEMDQRQPRLYSYLRELEVMARVISNS